ncbi:homeobox protein Hox-D9-like [Sorex araneus]|uniref:homeobox protein Hox-D9-like n=1 Tax=Sorex araneus TaxID=42254 RepID=UPI0024335422|nr:homeobox protein Hox-D9-like [Sorex araneus]
MYGESPVYQTSTVLNSGSAGGRRGKGGKGKKPLTLRPSVRALADALLRPSSGLGGGAAALGGAPGPERGGGGGPTGSPSAPAPAAERRREPAAAAAAAAVAASSGSERGGQVTRMYRRVKTKRRAGGEDLPRLRESEIAKTGNSEPKKPEH